MESKDTGHRTTGNGDPAWKADGEAGTGRRAVLDAGGASGSRGEGGSVTMKRSEYLQRAFDAYNEGRISEEVYDSMVMNADVFCDEDEREYGLPSTYAEVEYDDFDNPEAIAGARFDDMNYLRYTER